MGQLLQARKPCLLLRARVRGQRGDRLWDVRDKVIVAKYCTESQCLLFAMLCIPSDCNLAAFRLKRYLQVGCTFCKATRPLTWRQSRHARAPESHRCRPLIRASQTEAPEASTSGASMPIRTANGEMTAFPQTAGVYSIHSPDGQLQYIGLSRKVEHVKSRGKSLTHMSDLLQWTASSCGLSTHVPCRLQSALPPMHKTCQS